jgi:Rrf2 family protein
VNLHKGTRYALYAAVEMAAAGERPVTVADLARRHGLPQTALAKVFQQLVRAGLAVGTRGAGGGYRLARPPSKVSVLDVVTLFEAASPLRGGEGGVGPTTRRLSRLFDEVEELVRCTYASVSLASLLPVAPPCPAPPGRAGEPRVTRG